MPLLSSTEPPKAPFVYGPKATRAKRPSAPVPDRLLAEARETLPEPWDAAKHIQFQPPAKIHTMREIGLEGHGISPNAVSDPFPLFTHDAVRQMRHELFSQDVVDNCRRAPFTYNAWYSPEVLEKIAAIIGIELVPAFDADVAATNISVNDQNVKSASEDDHISATSWHYDSFPFVCVTMVSDCTGMVGGETAIKLPSGEIRKVRGPAMGTAIVLQGRYIQHQALKAFGGQERIAMVTSFRAKSPFVRDETVLTGVRTIADLEELYLQYTEYRLEILEERLRAKKKELQRRQVAQKHFNIADVRRFLIEQKEFLEDMLEEVYEVE
ncbi:hypothetical protein ACHAPT_012256 [Fusarium lateritium]